MENKKIFAPSHQEKACFKGFFCVFAILLILSALCLSAGAKATTVEVGIPVEEHPELFLPRSMPTHGEGKIAVFLIEFPDMRNENPSANVEYYERLYFKSYGQSVSKFYQDESYGKLKISGKVFDWYTAKHERSYYDNRKDELLLEAFSYYDSLGTDFDQFDGDGDGAIDSVCFHFAGEPEEGNQNAPWYPGVYISMPQGEWIAEFDGKKIISYIQLSELATFGNGMINVVCHELMHALGMLDLYCNVSYGVMPTPDLMVDNMLRVNPYTKILLGWIENVQVITADTENVRLDICGYDEWGHRFNGEPAIVTNSFNGFFDEFYLISYMAQSDLYATVIWHVDARLSADGKSFMNDNMTYNVSPGKDNSDPHQQPFQGDESPYLFIEEISGDPYYNYVTNRPYTLSLTAFSADSVLGPDSMPSSDTHDGKFTGIKIHNFAEHNYEYLTFDVSFVKDTSAPILITESNDIGCTDKVTVQFNEHIYEGSAWSSVKVTDLKGNALNATVKKSYYPCNEIQIIFNEGIPSEGYKIIFPEGCVADSSGNALKGTELSTADQDFFTPEKSTVLPNPAEYSRGSLNGFPVYYYDDSIVVLEHIVGTNDYEFLRIDYEGNVLTKKRIAYPFDSGMSMWYCEAGNGCYIISCSSSGNGRYDLLFCVDGDGNIKWTNDKYKGESVNFSINDGVKYKQGLLIEMQSYSPNYSNNIVYIDGNTGSIDILLSESPMLEELFGRGRWLLPDGKLLRVIDTINGNTGEREISIAIVNFETLEIERESVISEPRNASAVGYIIFGGMQIYDDGKIVLFRQDKPYYEAILLDENLNVIKTEKLDRLGQFERYDLYNNDGFCLVFRQDNHGMHANAMWCIRRYDRYLSFMWEAQVDCGTIAFGKSKDGDIVSLTEYYISNTNTLVIENYGEESEYRKEHVHSWVRVDPVPATCTAEGKAESERCRDCGEVISGGETIPALGHKEVNIPGKAATCTEPGTTAGTKCSVCGEILLSQKDIPAGGAHSEKIIPRIEPTCTSVGRTEGKECSVCGVTLIPQQEIPATGEHIEEIIPAVPATCSRSGWSEGVRCSVCLKDIIEPQITPPTEKHIEEIIPAVAPTQTSKGLTEGVRCTICGNTLVEQQSIPALGGCSVHVEKVIPASAPTCTSVGRTEGKECSVCGMVLIESKEIPALPHTEVIIYGYAATCKKEGRTDGAKCSVCGKTLISQKSTPKSNEHNPTIVSATEPTCTKQGRTEGAQCADCGIILVSWSVVPKLDHTEKILPAIAPTYTTTGKTEGKQCSECGKVLVEQEIVPILEQTEEITTSPENEPPADTGCGAAISAVMLPIVILGCAIIKKKD